MPPQEERDRDAGADQDYENADIAWTYFLRRYGPDIPPDTTEHQHQQRLRPPHFVSHDK
jgi:hypothetical protein